MLMMIMIRLTQIELIREDDEYDYKKNYFGSFVGYYYF